VIKVLVSVEGISEETFVREVLSPVLVEHNTWLTPVVLKTRRVPTGPDFRGGYLPYGRIRRELRRLLGDTSAAAVTTMYDLYCPGRKPHPSARREVRERQWFRTGQHEQSEGLICAAVCGDRVAKVAECCRTREAKQATHSCGQSVQYRVGR
jgi:hypothetical protein